MTFSRCRIPALLALFLLLWAGPVSARTRYIEYKQESIYAHLTVGKIHKFLFPEEIVDIFVPSASKVSVVHRRDYVYIKPLVPFEGVFLLEGVGRNTYEIAVKADNKSSYTIFKVLSEGITKSSLKEAPTSGPRAARPRAEPFKFSLIKSMIRGEEPSGYEVQDVTKLGLKDPVLLKNFSPEGLEYRLEKIYSSSSLKGLVIAIENVSDRPQFIDISRVEYPGWVIRAVLDKHLYPRGAREGSGDRTLLDKPHKTKMYIVIQENLL